MLILATYWASTNSFSLCEYTADPAGQTPGGGIGSLCVRNDAGNVGLYINTVGTTWVRIGGALGPLYPDDVPATFGTTSPAQGTVVYASVPGRFEITTIDISAVAATQATRPILIESGDRTTTDANAGTASGAVSVRTGATVQSGAANGGLSGQLALLTGSATQSANGTGAGSGSAAFGSGATDSTVAGGTGGPSGNVTGGSGNATSTAGTSGSTGTAIWQSGASDDANSGAVTVQSGTGVNTGAATVRSSNVPGAGTTGDVSLQSGSALGAGTSGNVNLAVGTTVGGARGSLVITTVTMTTTSAALTWTLIDNTAAALSMGAAGATNMLVFDTTNAAERLIVNAVGGIQAVDNVAHGVGTLANDQFLYRYNLANTRGEIVGTSITAGGATQATRGFSITTGSRIKNDNNAGVPTSGPIVFTTGTTDIQFAGGGATGSASGSWFGGSGSTDCTVGANTAGNTGAVSLVSGNATSTLGTSGSTGAWLGGSGASDDANTGAVSLVSGNAAGAGGGVTSGAVGIQSGTVGGTGTTGNTTIATGNAVGAGTSGNVVVTIGTTAGGTRGVLDINTDVIDLISQPTVIRLIDNQALALSFDAVGATGIAVIVTTNGAEAFTFRENALTNLAIGSRDVADGNIDAAFYLKKTYTAGASTVDTVLPARTGGWRLVDAYIISGGAAGGTVTVQTAGGAANCTDAMIPSALGAGGITRALLIANNTFASGATVRLAAAAMAPAGEAFLRFEGL